MSDLVAMRVVVPPGIWQGAHLILKMGRICFLKLKGISRGLKSVSVMYRVPTISRGRWLPDRSRIKSGMSICIPVEGP
jgi:hypothetical protein